MAVVLSRESVPRSPSTSVPVSELGREPVREAREIERRAPLRRDAPNLPVAPAVAFSRLLDGLAHRIDSGERSVAKTLARGAAGADLSTGELLALQSGIYRYSESIDLVAKFVDRAGSGVRTVLQGQ